MDKSNLETSRIEAKYQFACEFLTMTMWYMLPIFICLSISHIALIEMNEKSAAQ